MRKIVANMFMSTDGVVERPDRFHFPFHNSEVDEIMTAGTQENDVFLLGRTLYDEWSQYWPQHLDGDPFGRYIHEIPKYVLTHRPLDGEPWHNTTVIGGDDAVAQLGELKAGGDGSIGMSGSMTTVRWLLDNGLLDEVALLIDPVVVGSGRRLLEGDGPVQLTPLVGRVLSNGVVHARYAVG